MSVNNDNSNLKDSEMNRSSNDASTPIVNHKTVGRNSSQLEEGDATSTIENDRNTTTNYVGGDAERSSSSHQFHEISKQNNRK